MAHAFYPFVDNEDDGAAQQGQEDELVVRYPARIAVYDDLSSAPRVVVVEPQDVRSYLEEITQTVTKLAKEQGGTIPFTVIREIVENYIHAYFIEPTISILDRGNTIRFADQGPGIEDKDLAMEFGTTSATRAMKHYIRGTGAGLPLVQEYMEEHNGSLRVEDNISNGTIITISTRPPLTDDDADDQGAPAQQNGMSQRQGGAMPEVQDAGMQAAMMPAAMAQEMQPQQVRQPAAQSGQALPQQTQQPYGYGYQYAPGTWPPQQAASAPLPQYPYPAYPQQVQPAGVVSGMPLQQQVPAWQPQAQGYQLALTSRGELILSYLTQHESVGPTELRNLYGSSISTWSRELKTLENAGVIYKQGQKRFLTDAGRQLLAQRNQ